MEPNGVEVIHKNIIPPPMRGIKQAYEEIKEIDPNTAITERGLRRLILTETIPCIKIGKKYLINMNHLYAYFNFEKSKGNVANGGAIKKVRA